MKDVKYFKANNINNKVENREKLKKELNIIDNSHNIDDKSRKKLSNYYYYLIAYNNIIYLALKSFKTFASSDNNEDIKGKSSWIPKGSWFDNENIQNIINKKRKVDITCWDMFLKNFYLCFASKKYFIINQAMEFIDNSLDEENFAFNNMKEQILRRVLIDEDRYKLFIIPSININNEKASDMFFKETLKENLEEDYGDNKENNISETFRRLLDLDISHEANLTLLKLFLMSNI